MEKLIALVTGANRGMGLATTTRLLEMNYHVIMVGKNLNDLSTICQKLKEKSFSVEYFHADMENKEDLYKLIDYINKSHQRIDVLINNAGIYIEEKNFLDLNESIFEKTFHTNTFAPYILIKGILPLMIQNNFGRIVNVSSGLGSFDDASSFCLSYSVSKGALNILTNIFSKEVRNKNIKINSVCPGWVKTDMGGMNAPRSIEQGIAGIIWAATLDSNGPSGGFFRDQKPLNW